MDELLRQFWELYKQERRIRFDLSSYPGGHDGDHRGELKRAQWKLDRLAMLVDAAEADESKPKDGTNDVPGQMFFTDLSVPMPAEVAAKGAA